MTGILSPADFNHAAMKTVPEQGLVILFQGDSITDSDRSRNIKGNHLMGFGYAHLISNRLLENYPAAMLRFYNRGISGNTITDLAERWKKDTLDLRPDIFSILIGVNDVMHYINGDDSFSAANYHKEFIALIENTKEKLPDILLVLCEPFILPAGIIQENLEVWNEQMVLRQEIVNKLARTYNAVFVGLQEPFNQACHKMPADYWTLDGVHPLSAGHELIAGQWISQVTKAITF